MMMMLVVVVVVLMNNVRVLFVYLNEICIK